MKIGFFDTGLGGVTILKEAYKKINADYIYMADNENAPYGLKNINDVRNLTEKCIKKLIDLECKIIVIACNTATSAAIDYLRKKYSDIIFIGTEPAIKPAIEKSNEKKVIITSTTLTSKGEKLLTLIDSLNAKDKVLFLPLDDLVKYADFFNEIQYDEAYNYLKTKFNGMNFNEYSSIVLGCTHFPIFKDEFRKLLPQSIEIFDSADGIVKLLTEKVEKKVTNKNLEILLTSENEEFKNKILRFMGKK